MEKAKEKFYKLDFRTRENLLMETSMRIQEVFGEMWFTNKLDPDKIDTTDTMERLIIFRDWVREFEEKYYGTDDYEDDFIWLSEEYATEKMKERFGKETV